MAIRILKRRLLVSGCYIVLIAILLIGITLARYQDAKLAYTSFGAASFNALILGENTVEAMTDPVNPVVNKFGVNLQTTGFRPGMLWNEDPGQSTAGCLPFSVTNGTTDADSSQVSVEYSVRLRTSGNLPLEYTLALWVADETEEGGGHYEYYAAGAPQLVTGGGSDGGTWYEYAFYPREEGGSGASGETEAVFELKGGSLRLNGYRLILEWPVRSGGENEADTNSPVYMKEVELIEILVTVSSKNMLAEDGYTDTEIPASGNVYSTGVIVLDPEKTVVLGGENGEEGWTGYSYRIDLRSFSQNGAGERSFTFRVENGVGKAVVPRSAYTVYDMLLKIPVSVHTAAYQYTLYTDDGGEGVALGAPQEYRLYNELDGTYEVSATAEYPEGKSEPQYRMYAVYPVAAGRMLVNIINNPSGEGTIPYVDGDAFRLSVSKPDHSEITNAELEDISFENKLEVLVRAEFTDEPR